VSDTSEPVAEAVSEAGGQALDPFAPVVHSIRPEPEPEVTAAIMAAVQECWPRPVPSASSRPATALWRFSGRWWAKPTAARRERPWTGGTR
jgi:hypothetical protein